MLRPPSASTKPMYVLSDAFTYDNDISVILLVMAISSLPRADDRAHSTTRPLDECCRDGVYRPFYRLSTDLPTFQASAPFPLPLPLPLLPIPTHLTSLTQNTKGSGGHCPPQC